MLDREPERRASEVHGNRRAFQVAAAGADRNGYGFERGLDASLSSTPTPRWVAATRSNWLVSIGLPTSAIAALLLRQWGNVFQASIRIGLGPLAPVVVGPQYHRIHHSLEVKHLDHNFAAFFPLWDCRFGTYWSPATGEWPDGGLPDVTGILGLRELLLAPFLGWRRALRGRS